MDWDGSERGCLFNQVASFEWIPRRQGDRGSTAAPFSEWRGRDGIVDEIDTLRWDAGGDQLRGDEFRDRQIPCGARVFPAGDRASADWKGDTARNHKRLSRRHGRFSVGVGVVYMYDV